MFEKYGEFDSCRDLNAAAEGLKNEGDTDALISLALENGIDREDAEDYSLGYMKELASPLTAALGRLKVEKAASRIPDPAKDVIYGMAEAMCTGDNTVQTLVMYKGARVDAVWAHMEDIARKNKSGSMGVVCGTDADLRRMLLSALKEGADHEKG